MSCTIDYIRWLLSVFNLMFSLCALLIISFGIYGYQHLDEVHQEYQSEVAALLIGAVLIGIIIFVTAFFGLCSAVRGSQFMAFIYAGLLLVILLIQLSFAIIVTVKTNGFEEKAFKEVYEKEFNQYWTSNISRGIIDFTQFGFACCGVDSPNDFSSSHLGMNGTYPLSCCQLTADRKGCLYDQYQPSGCVKVLVNGLKYTGRKLIIIFLNVIGIEIIGIIFSVYLINFIRNAHHRAFKA